MFCDIGDFLAPIIPANYRVTECSGNEVEYIEEQMKDVRYTIGFLTQFSSSSDGFQNLVWKSMVDAARKHNVNGLFFAGGQIDNAPYNPFEKNLNVVYDLIKRDKLDGLVISNIITAFINTERLREFCRNFGLPVVFFLGAVEGFSGTQVVNKESMREIVLHLARDHQYKNIAFIIGTKGYPDSEVRFAAYRETLIECGLTYDPELTFQGQFDVASGVQAVKHWYKNKTRKIDAIIASNDAMAFGAINTLRSMGIRVPVDVAVTGFDDTREAAAFCPPLTTARQAFEEACTKAIDILCDTIEGKSVPALVTVPSRMIIRQSCGCVPGLVLEAENILHRNPENTGLEITSPYITSPYITGPYITGVDVVGRAPLQREVIVKELLAAAPENEAKQISNLLTVFIDDVENKQPGAFINELRTIFQEKILRNQGITSWHRYLFILGKWIPSLWSDTRFITGAGNKILQAGVLIGESALQASDFQRALGEKKFQELRETGQELITTFKFEELKEVIGRQLDRLHIPSCFISLFRNNEVPQEGPQGGAEVFLLLNDNSKSSGDDHSSGYSVHALPEKQFFPTGRQFLFAVHPLYFREIKLGYAMFELGPVDGIIYDTLQVQISSSLMGSKLIRQRESTEVIQKERSDAIQELVRPMIKSIEMMTSTAREKIGMIDDLKAVTKENRQKLSTTNEAIKSMSERIGKMSEVIEIIDDISARVNILAINTSIESTHAGKFGKGFMVIAGEIRKLADSISNNTKEITKTLADIRPAIEISRKAGNENRESFIHLEKDVLDLAETLNTITSAMDDLSISSSRILAIMNTKPGS